MTKIAPHHVCKTMAGWIPKSNAAREFHAKTKLGQIVEMKARRPRNPGHHRKLFALLAIVAENNEEFADADEALVAVKAATGHGHWKKIKGTTREIFYPASIAFDAMGQDEFEDFYNAAVAAVRRWWLPVDNDELEEAINAFAA